MQPIEPSPRKKPRKQQYSNVETVKKKIRCQYPKLEEGFVIRNVGISLMSEQIIVDGLEEFRQIEPNFTQHDNGKMPLKMYGNEIMQLVKDVVLNSTKTQAEKHTSITLYRFNQSNIEQMLIIYYWFYIGLT